ncbi:MAG: thiamine pyrophosphate-dependent enzyme [Desulfosudis oleivorans]|nr:thiamine pyrophosphate-dependent enzyme [Desulfosudis oleivorans]
MDGAILPAGQTQPLAYFGRRGHDGLWPALGHRRVVCAARTRKSGLIAGDGGFQMTAAELTTAVQEGANVKVAIMNNSFLGMVRQWQEFFFEKRYSAVNMLTPDFVKLAEAHGVPARRVTKREEVDEAIAWARKTRRSGGDRIPRGTGRRGLPDGSCRRGAGSDDPRPVKQ